MDFIAIDLETPNAKNNTICSMGITVVKNSKIVSNENILINPHSKFDQINMTIHGITKEMVKDAPTFAEAWKEWEKAFKHTPAVVMHNAQFDAAVLAKAASKEKVILPEMDIYCTMQLYKENYGFESCSLDSLCQRYHIDLEHHNSGSDSKCTAKLMIKLLEDEDAAIHSRFSATEFGMKTKEWERRMEKREEAKKEYCEEVEKGAEETNENIVVPDCVYEESPILFEGKRFVITGALPGIGRSEAKAYIEEQGGKVTGSVSTKTDYLIVGLEDLKLVGADGKSGKIEEAERLNAEGCRICIIKAEKLIEKMKE